MLLISHGNLTDCQLADCFRGALCQRSPLRSESRSERISTGRLEDARGLDPQLGLAHHEGDLHRDEIRRDRSIGGEIRELLTALASRVRRSITGLRRMFDSHGHPTLACDQSNSISVEALSVRSAALGTMLTSSCSTGAPA
jgi:hypothetical protein